MLPFEIIYFLHQIPKMPNSVLLRIISKVQDALALIEINLGSNLKEQELLHMNPAHVAEIVSGNIIVMIAYCFLGDSDIAALFGERLLPIIDHLLP